MDNEKINEITTSIQEKLGEETSAIISDDLSKLTIYNNDAQKEINELNSEISNLKDKNEKLVLANGNLLQQIPVGFKKEEKNDNENSNNVFSFKNCFDEKGNFKK